MFNANPTAAAQAAASPSSASTACTWSTPFKWGVRFNGEEIAIGEFEEAFHSANKNDVILAYHWSIKMYTCLQLVI